VGLRAGMDGCGKSRPPTGSDPRNVQPHINVEIIRLLKSTLIGYSSVSVPLPPKKYSH
jgi:hypothetical protein